MEKKVITNDFTQALRSMKVGDVITLSVKSYSTMRTIISRLRVEMCVEGYDWKFGRVDRKTGTFNVKRVS